MIVRRPTPVPGRQLPQQFGPERRTAWPWVALAVLVLAAAIDPIDLTSKQEDAQELLRVLR